MESSVEDYDASRDPLLADNFFERYHDITWYEQHLEICQNIIRESSRMSAHKEWQAFNLYVTEEYTPADIARVMQCTVGEARRYLQNALNVLKEKADLKNLGDWKIIESNNVSKEFQKNRARTNAERTYVKIDPNEKLTVIMEQYGVTKPTASRMRDRAKKNPNNMAWYVPDYFNYKNEDNK